VFGNRFLPEGVKSGCVPPYANTNLIAAQGARDFQEGTVKLTD
jgi:hypothetical protein